MFAALAVGTVLSVLAYTIYRRCLPHLPLETELEDHVAAVVGYRLFFLGKKAMILVFFHQTMSTLLMLLPASWTVRHVAHATAVLSLQWMSAPAMARYLIMLRAMVYSCTGCGGTAQSWAAETSQVPRLKSAAFRCATGRMSCTKFHGFKHSPPFISPSRPAIGGSSSWYADSIAKGPDTSGCCLDVCCLASDRHALEALPPQQ